MKQFPCRSALLLSLLWGISACQPTAKLPLEIASSMLDRTDLAQPEAITISQSANTTLLVRLTGFETEFESRLVSGNNLILSQARLPYLRSGPLFQLIDPSQSPRDLQIVITPANMTRNSSVTIDVFRLPSGSGANQKQIDAYRLYSKAVQSLDSEDTALWSPRAAQLEQAAGLFEDLGLEKQRLWSEYLAAYLTYFPLYKLQSAIGMARKVQVQARVAGLPLLELMAAQLEGQALIERNDSDSPALAAQKIDQAQKVLKKSAELALAQGMRFEQTWAINNRGIGYYYLDLPHAALEQYQQALQIAFELEDAYLINLVGGNIALVNERLGDYAAALEALLAIKQELAQSGSAEERAHNLAEIGRVYANLFLFPQAVDALTEAMNISRELDTKEGTGRIGFSLARAYYGMGQRERARDMLLAAIHDMKEAHFGRVLREGYRLLADMHRFRGEHTLVEKDREQQGQLLVSDRDRALFLFDRGLDARARGDTVHAGLLFTESHEAAIAAADASIQIRSLLQHCALAPASSPENAACKTKRLESMLNDWLPRAIPGDALDARFTWAQLLVGRGDDAAALMVLRDLVADIRVYRARLPGVLGAWYWESRRKVFTAYMDLLLKHVQSQEQVTGALLALDRFRNLEVAGRRHRDSRHESEADDVGAEIRGLIASMARAQDDHARLAFSQKIDQFLLSAGTDSEFDRAADEDLLSGLESLPADAAFLTYYFSGAGAWAWLAGRQGLHLVYLGDAQPVLELLGKVRASLRMVGYGELDQDLDRLGALLLEPLRTTLPDTIYLGPVGELAGLPFGAIRSSGRYLAQDHTVINLMSLNGLRDSAHSERVARAWDNVFLAGAPTDLGGDLANLPGAASEIEDIARLFAGRRVYKITGEDLQRARFSGPAFNEAGLIHIASHGTINLDYPELSRLILSGRSEAGGLEYLTPFDIRQVPIKAGLVVLSACETTGLNDFSFDNNLGFVSEFLQSGADAIIASLWPVSDRQTRDFMVDFYSALLKGTTISNALARTKRKYMNAARSDGIQDWASFQVYID